MTTEFSPFRWRHSRLAGVVATARHTRLVRALMVAANGLLDAASNARFDWDRNGERELLTRLAGQRVRVVFDVGACRGDWTARALELMAPEVVHCFDVDPVQRRHVADRFRDDPRVVVADEGLLDDAGWVSFLRYPANPALNSLVDVGQPIAYTAERGAVTTGDAYARAAGVDTVDLLKIDVEGSDLRVLRGFDGLLRNGRVRVVQFEYTLAWVPSGALLNEAGTYLGERGYVVGRLFRDGVEFGDVVPTHETFRGGNFVAVRRDDTALARALDATRGRHHRAG